jgi:hypothetical protein
LRLPIIFSIPTSNPKNFTSWNEEGGHKEIVAPMKCDIWNTIFPISTDQAKRNKGQLDTPEARNSVERVYIPTLFNKSFTHNSARVELIIFSTRIMFASEKIMPFHREKGETEVSPIP